MQMETPPTITADKYPLLCKFAHAAANDYMGHSMQQYLPVNERRDFSELEEAELMAAQSKIIPKIFPSLRDSPSVGMSSPWTPAVGLGAVGATGGGLLGAILGGTMNSDSSVAPGIGALLGAGAGGLGLGALGYHSRKAENENLEEMMRRLPEGGTRRDMMSDPVYQMEQTRKNQLAQAAIIGGALVR